MLSLPVVSLALLIDGMLCSRSQAEQCIMMAAKIIAPVIDSSYTVGYNWCIDQVKSSQYMELAHSLDIDKAIGFLKQKDFQQVPTISILSFLLHICLSSITCPLSFNSNIFAQLTNCQIVYVTVIWWSWDQIFTYFRIVNATFVLLLEFGK